MNSILKPKVKPSIRDLLRDNELFLLKENLNPCHVAALCKKLFQNNPIPQQEYHEHMYKPKFSGIFINTYKICLRDVNLQYLYTICIV